MNEVSDKLLHRRALLLLHGGTLRRIALELGFIVSGK